MVPVYLFKSMGQKILVQTNEYFSPLKNIGTVYQYNISILIPSA